MGIAILVTLLRHPSEEAKSIGVTDGWRGQPGRMGRTIAKVNSLALFTIDTRILQLFPLSLGSEVRIELRESISSTGQIVANRSQSPGKIVEFRTCLDHVLRNATVSTRMQKQAATDYSRGVSETELSTLMAEALPIKPNRMSQTRMLSRKVSYDS